MNKTTISWVRNPEPFSGTGSTWNPFAGCSPNKPSRGCDHCYAERLAATRLMHLPACSGLATTTCFDKDGFTTTGGERFKWSGEVRFFPEKLAEPLRRRTPSGIFVGDMGDIGLLPFEQIAAIFGVMAACPHHRFYLLTKRPARLRQWATAEDTPKIVDGFKHMALAGRIAEYFSPERTIDVPWYPGYLVTNKEWPLRNAFVGTSVCTCADLGNLDELRRIPAAVRYVSFEPLLEDLGTVDLTGIAWAIIGGESGPRARPCHVKWIRSLVGQCKAAGCATWVKQLGANIAGRDCEHGRAGETCRTIDRAGASMDEWPADLRVRELPKGV